MVDIIQSLLQQAAAKGRKSTALSPLGWLAATFVAAILGALQVKAPEWLLVCLVIGLGLVTLAYLRTYLRFAEKRPDLLRSESFIIQQTALKKMAVGDSRRGAVTPDDGKRIGAPEGPEGLEFKS